MPLPSAAGKGILDVQPSAPGEAAREKNPSVLSEEFQRNAFHSYRGEITRAFPRTFQYLIQLSNITTSLKVGGTMVSQRALPP